MTNPSGPKPSPTEEELEAWLASAQGSDRDSWFALIVVRLIHALRTARKERDEALTRCHNYDTIEREMAPRELSFRNDIAGLREALTDRDRMLRAHEETIGRLRYALVKVRAHTSHLPSADAELLRGLLASIERITDDALAAAPPGEYEQRVRREALEEAAKAVCARCRDGVANYYEYNDDERRHVWEENGNFFEGPCDAGSIRALVSKEA